MEIEKLKLILDMLSGTSDKVVDVFLIYVAADLVSFILAFILGMFVIFLLFIWLKSRSELAMQRLNMNSHLIQIASLVGVTVTADFDSYDSDRVQTQINKLKEKVRAYDNQ